ncbi:hypothetical protein EIP91_006810 [Steccherinum ochraceum]|uniref:Uncharacterized protein n=1 Tax=Steccherinum ochraceum TaxID=92696 RepID=A0A4R0RDH1_9APHY|nr:hypothetical protein EIP91_006810 [Steccherinum ochraceum]
MPRLPGWLNILGRLKTSPLPPPCDGSSALAKAHFATSLPEILLCIFECSVPAEYTCTMDYSAVHWSLAGRSHSSLLFDALNVDLRTLLAACLVCKEWYAVGVTVLYTRPVIITAHQRSRFCRTLRDNLLLGGLVHHLRLLCTELVPPRETVIGGQYVKYSKMELKEAGACARNELAASLLHCVNLISLDTTGCETRPAIFPLHKILTVPCIQNTLRQLVISGPSSVGLPASDVSLPSLEVLRLLLVPLPIGYTFPVLPAVFTLQFTHCCTAPNKQRSPTFAEHPSDTVLENSLSIDIAQFPSLQLLDLHENDFALEMSEDLAKNITEVRFTGWSESRLLQPTVPLFPFPVWLRTAPSLRHLITTAYLWSREYRNSSFMLALERLTLLWVDAEDGFGRTRWHQVDTDVNGMSTRDSSARALDILYHVVVSSRAPMLRRIALVTLAEDQWRGHNDWPALPWSQSSSASTSDRRQRALAPLKAACVEKNVVMEQTTLSRDLL